MFIYTCLKVETDVNMQKEICRKRENFTWENSGKQENICNCVKVSSNWNLATTYRSMTG